MDDNQGVYEFDEFRLFASQQLLLRRGERVSLRPKTYLLLLYLAKHPGQLFEKKQLLDKIWSDAIVEEGNLNRTVSELRKLLGDSSGESRYIETIPRVGYRFIGDVTFSEGENQNGIKEKHNSFEPKLNELIEKTPTRNFLKFAAFALISVSLIVIFAAAIWNYSKNQSLAKGLDNERQLTFETTDETSPSWLNKDKILYRVQEKGKKSILFETNAEGTNAQSTKLRVSPDGTKSLITDESDPKYSFIANADGSNQRRIPIPFGNNDWSRVSSELVVQIEPLGKRDAMDIGIIHLETLEFTNITNSTTFEADPSFSPDGQKILFTSTRDGNADIYVMKRDGSSIERLTNNPAWESFATFSPDMTQISFNSDRENEKNNVYIMNLDGSGKTVSLPAGNYSNFVGTGVWSPDGTKIAYSSDRNGNEDIFIINAEIEKPALVAIDAKADISQLLQSRDGTFGVYVAQLEKDQFEIRKYYFQTKTSSVIQKLQNDTGISLSSDGNSIAFQGKVDTNTEIVVSNIDGSNKRTLTNNPAIDANPVFSPDGSQIAFVTNRGDNRGLFDLYQMNADGSNQRPIAANNGGTNFSPAWSSDGKEIYFANDKEDGRNGNFEIFKTALNSVSLLTRITNRPQSADESPAVSPDGKRIAFQSTQKGNSEIYTMNSDGSGLLRITRNLADDKNPKWSADGSRLFFSSNRNGKYQIFEISVAR